MTVRENPRGPRTICGRDAFHCVPIFSWVNVSREKPPTACCKVLSAFTLQNCILTSRSQLSSGAPAGGTATSSLGRLHGPCQQIWGVGHKGSFRSSSLLLAGFACAVAAGTSQIVGLWGTGFWARTGPSARGSAGAKCDCHALTPCARWSAAARRSVNVWKLPTPKTLWSMRL